MAILSRSFCNANQIEDIKLIHDLFIDEVNKIREAEQVFAGFDEMKFSMNHQEIITIVNNIVSNL